MCGIADAHLPHPFADGAGMSQLLYSCPGVPHRPANDVPPGPCFHRAPESSQVMPEHPYRCELLAGHLGAHVAPLLGGGTITWEDEA